MRQMSEDNGADGAWLAEGGEPTWIDVGTPTLIPPAEDLVGIEAEAEMPAAAMERQAVHADMLTLLASELAGTQDQLVEAAAKAADPVAAKAAFDAYGTELGMFANAVEGVGLIALKAVLDFVQQQVVARRGEAADATLMDTLTLIPGLVIVYLQGPNDTSVCQGITDVLQQPVWDKPLSPEEAAALASRLAAVQVTRDAALNHARATEVTEEDVSLEFPPDINPELLGGLLQELPQHTADFSAAVQRLTTGQGSAADVDTAKRSAHTLKGAANTVGIRGIANLTHHLEDILVALSASQFLPRPALAAMLTEASDCLEAMSEAVSGIGPQPDQSQAVLQNVLDWANRIDREGEAALREEAAASPAQPETAVPAGEAENPAPASAAPADRQATEEGQAPMMWVSALLVDELLRLVGETIISTSQIHERLRKVSAQSVSIRNQNNAFLQLASELEHVVDIHGLPVAARANSQAADFDPLEFEHYSELHTLSRRLIEAAHDSREISGEVAEDLNTLRELVETQNRLHMESQKAVLQTRMVQVKTAVPRLQRSLRQACRLLEKRVDLDVRGTDTPIDANILNQLMDPLMHLLRNAVDHGIEAEAVRAARGKAHPGRIGLSFYREANHMVVRCEDDGAGLDLARIRARAIERQLIIADDNLSDEELTRLVLLPGFSTRGEATQISGRGIGMDIVNSRILELKGSLTLHSTAGKGLRVELRVPAALISTHALLVRQGERVVALSTHGIEDIHYATDGQIQTLGEELIYHSGSGMHTLDDMEELLHSVDRRGRNRNSAGATLLLVRLDDGAVRAVRVQEILDSRDLVVKKLNRYVPRVMGVVGAAILGDGTVSPVMDLPELLRAPTLAGREGMGATSFTGTGTGAEAHDRVTALVVDDSLSARRTTAQLMKDAGYEVRTAIDGMEAAAILEKWTPSVMLVDMEMPRMNGLELTSHVRGKPATAKLPIVMITSRSTEKHRQQAENAGVDVYLTKPYRDAALLDHVNRLTVRRDG